MPPGRPRQFNEFAVIEKAMDAFWLHGFNGIGIHALLKHMGISRQSMYNTFGDKRQLFMRTLQHYDHHYLKPQAALLKRPGSSVTNILDFARAICDLAQKDAARGCMITNTLVELGPHDPEVRGAVASMLGHVEQEVSTCIEHGQAAGEIPTEADAAAYAHAICSTVVGMAVTSKMSPPDTFFDHSLKSIRDMLSC